MKTTFFFILTSVLLIVSCKKKDLEPTTTKTNYSLKHSGIVDSNTFNLDTNAVTSQLIQMNQWDDFLYKAFEIQTWLTGPNLTTTVAVGEERLTLYFAFILEYNISEYDPNCSCLPTPSASRLANHINNTSYEWNDASEMKEVQILAWNSQFATGSFQIVNPQISAEAIGNTLHIHGTIDSLEIGSLSTNRFLTDLHFDYTVPVNP